MIINEEPYSPERLTVDKYEFRVANMEESFGAKQGWFLVSSAPLLIGSNTVQVWGTFARPRGPLNPAPKNPKRRSR